MEVPIIYATETGVSEEFAQTIATEAPSRGAPTMEPKNVTDIDYPNVLQQHRVIVFVTSSFGDGDPPDSAVPFYKWLCELAPGTLNGLQFTILGLGDLNYVKYQGFPRALETHLLRLGGTPFYERGECDNSDDIDADFENWREGGFWDALQNTWSMHGHLGPLTPTAANDSPLPKFVIFGKQEECAAMLKDIQASCEYHDPTTNGDELLADLKKPSVMSANLILCLADLSALANTLNLEGGSLLLGRKFALLDVESNNQKLVAAIQKCGGAIVFKGEHTEEIIAFLLENYGIAVAATNGLVIETEDLSLVHSPVTDYASTKDHSPVANGIPVEYIASKDKGGTGNINTPRKGPVLDDAIGRFLDWVDGAQEVWVKDVEVLAGSETDRRMVHVEFETVNFPVGDNLEILPESISTTVRQARKALKLEWEAALDGISLMDLLRESEQYEHFISKGPGSERRLTETRSQSFGRSSANENIWKAENSEKVMSVSRQSPPKKPNDPELQNVRLISKTLVERLANCKLGIHTLRDLLVKVFALENTDLAKVKNATEIAEDPISTVIFTKFPLSRPRHYTLVGTSGICVTKSDKGQCSTWLTADEFLTGPEAKQKGFRRRLLVKHVRSPLHLKVVLQQKSPAILIGTGAGLGVFAGYVRHFQKIGQSPFSSLHVFGGVRTMQDLPYRQNELNPVSTHVYVDGVFVATSREGDKCYVQQRIQEQAAFVKQKIEEEKGYVYLCGGQQFIKETVKLLKIITGSDLKEGRVIYEQWTLGGKRLVSFSGIEFI